MDDTATWAASEDEGGTLVVLRVQDGRAVAAEIGDGIARVRFYEHVGNGRWAHVGDTTLEAIPMRMARREAGPLGHELPALADCVPFAGPALEGGPQLDEAA